jgi:hypothetical protein
MRITIKYAYMICLFINLFCLYDSFIIRNNYFLGIGFTIISSILVLCYEKEVIKEYKLESFYTPEVKMTSKTMKKRTAKAMRARSSEQRRAIMLGFKNKKEYNKAASKFKSL